MYVAADHDLQADGTRPCRTPGHPKGVPCAGCWRLLSPEHRKAIQEEREGEAFRAAWGAFFMTLLDAQAAFGDSAPAFFSDIHESALASALITYRQHVADTGGF
ncbi:hypothetical protein [Streptomyces mobaraensis]|uniref:Uncharacterized protein n=1 Tax=Streptomyces mobaraensis TaxID=35621 RepID=A0A5N5W1Z8_STRMB|nr:hypothetical protein [Streptomyces mobaraensis]KAB7835917.1 hypothetical protein FRZ00_26055 [Streptomyces mobaraensis]